MFFSHLFLWLCLYTYKPTTHTEHVPMKSSAYKYLLECTTKFIVCHVVFFSFWYWCCCYCFFCLYSSPLLFLCTNNLMPDNAFPSYLYEIYILFFLPHSSSWLYYQIKYSIFFLPIFYIIIYWDSWCHTHHFCLLS